MVYNFNLGIGWASSGVEYAQSYRANLLRRAHIPARFVFTDMFPTENIEHMTRNIGFLDEEVIWLYTFFTDVRTSHVTFTLKELEATMAEEDYTFPERARRAGISLRRAAGSTPATWLMIQVISCTESRLFQTDA